MEAAEKSVQEKKKASGRLQQAQPKASSAEKKKKAKKEKQAKAGSDCKKRGHSSSTPTSDETADKHETWKPSAHALPTNDQEPHTSKSSSTRKEARKAAKKEQRKALSSSSSSSSSSANMVQELSSQMNESLRWEGVLDDPVAEEERIRQYKLNRRRRYMLAAVSESTTPAKITQQATMDNRQSLKQHPLPVLSEDYRLLSKKDHSNAYFLGHPDQRVRNAELGIKLTPLQSPALARISQEAV